RNEDLAGIEGFDRDGTRCLKMPTRYRSRLRQGWDLGRSQTSARWKEAKGSATRQGQLCRTYDLRERYWRDEGRQRRDLRTSTEHNQIQDNRRGCNNGQRDRLRPLRRHLDQQPQDRSD